MRIAHLINPVKVGEERDLSWQQPITFESMRIAKDFIYDHNVNSGGILGEVDVEHFACFYPEDEDMVPDGFIKVDPLKESTSGKFKVERKLPYFKEMLDRLYEVSDADYFIQTNADIGLQPYFYLLIKQLIDDGIESFCINKRIIPESFVESIMPKNMPLPLVWSFIGGNHAGHDCFVFKRELYPKLKIGKIVMGTPWSEATLIASLVAFSENFKVFKYANATFHLGDRRVWIGHELNDYRIHNTNEFARILKMLSKKNENILEHETIRYLLGKLKTEVKGYRNEVYSQDCWDLVK